MADPAPLPWLYPYREDPQSLRLGQPVYRPFVSISLANGSRDTPQLVGLIDTGADAVLVSDLLAEELGVDLDDHEGETLGRGEQPRDPAVALLKRMDRQEIDYQCRQQQQPRDPVNLGETVVKAATPTVARFSRVVRRHPGLYRALVRVTDGAHVSNYSDPILVR